MSDAPASGSRIIDLNAVVSPDIVVKIDDGEYRLPGDAPSEIMLRLVMLMEQEVPKAIEAQDAERIQQVRTEITEAIESLFAIRQEVEEGEFDSLSEKQVGALVSQLFTYYYVPAEGEGDEPEEGGGRPTSEGSTKQKPKNAGRSRRSSRKGRAAKAPARRSLESSPT